MWKMQKLRDNNLLEKQVRRSAGAQRLLQKLINIPGRVRLAFSLQTKWNETRPVENYNSIDIIIRRSSDQLKKKHETRK